MYRVYVQCWHVVQWRMRLKKERHFWTRCISWARAKSITRWLKHKFHRYANSQRISCFTASLIDTTNAICYLCHKDYSIVWLSFLWLRLKIKDLDIYIPPLIGKRKQSGLQCEVAMTLGGAVQATAAHCPSEQTLDPAVCSYNSAQPAALWPSPAMFSGNDSLFLVASITR